MTRTRLRTWEEYVLLLVSVSAAAVAVGIAADTRPHEPTLWGASAAALGLALATGAVFWLAGRVTRVVEEARRDESRDAHALLSALPEGLLVVGDGRIQSVNRRLCELLGWERSELVGAAEPFPFWPPEHRHEIAAWQRRLDEQGEHAGRLCFLGRGGRRIPVLLAGSMLPNRRCLLAVRDVSDADRRERRLAELASRDPETALLNERGFEERLREHVRRATTSGNALTVAVLQLGSDAPTWTGRLGSPAALLAVERLDGLVRAGEELARVADDLVAWIIPDAGAEGTLGSVLRIRRGLADLGVTVTTGVCDLDSAGDGTALLALADQALAEARRRGLGTSVAYPFTPASSPLQPVVGTDAQGRAAAPA
jgi:PAS domain S-box-containing protein